MREKGFIPGYSGHVPLRRDDVIGKTHGDGIMEADVLWKQKRFLDPPPAKPKKHAGSDMMPTGWYGNAPHHTMAREEPTDRILLTVRKQLPLDAKPQTSKKKGGTIG